MMIDSTLCKLPKADQTVPDAGCVQEILALTRDANCTPKAWATVIGNHPAVTRQILKIVNSAYDFLPRPIASVQQAMVYLGFNTVKNIAGDIALKTQS